MSAARTLPKLPLLAALMAVTGCVERRFVVETNVPGAAISVNNAAIGPSPADSRWDYAGKYEFKVVAQGYEPLTRIENVRAKWYDYPPLDFIFEALWPFHIEDVRRYRFELVPATQIRTDELLDAANGLRAQGQSLPAPKYPDPPPKPAPGKPAIVPANPPTTMPSPAPDLPATPAPVIPLTPTAPAPMNPTAPTPGMPAATTWNK